MAWSILLLIVAVLFAFGFIWPGTWFFAAGVFVLWVIATIFWGGRGRSGRTTVEGERSRRRVE